MGNLTITVASDVLKRARIRALDENTSVNAVLASHLERWSRSDELRGRREEAVSAWPALPRKQRQAAAAALGAATSCMNADVLFLGTNVLVYLCDEDEPRKKAIARALLRRGVAGGHKRQARKAKRGQAKRGQGEREANPGQAHLFSLQTSQT
jgi:hypothetical protein